MYHSLWGIKYGEYMVIRQPSVALTVIRKGRKKLQRNNHAGCLVKIGDLVYFQRKKDKEINCFKHKGDVF